VNFSLKASNEPNSAEIVAPSSPTGEPPPLALSKGQKKA